MNCYFCESIPGPSELATLDGSESHHAATSRRQRTGDRVALIDGRGARANAVIRSITPSAVELVIESRSEVAAQAPAVVVASALPKGDRIKTMLDMMTQLGVSRFVPLNCERGVVKATAGGLGRWRRVCLEACKQSHNPFLPAVEVPQDPAAFVRRIMERGAPVWAADPAGGGLGLGRDQSMVALCIGPEGGFTEGERTAMIDAGACLLNLGRNILRIETAAVAAVCAVNQAAGAGAYMPRSV